MLVRRIRPLLLLAGLAWMGSARAADQAAFLLGYDVYASGLHVMSATVEVALDGSRYRIETDARTGGVLGSLFSWRNGSSSEGRFGPDGPIPDLHRSEGEWRGRARRVVLGYDGRGAVSAEVEPAAQEDRREPVPPDLAHGTLDPLSAMLAVLVRAASVQGCTATVPVFDGRRRYDLESRDAGARTVRPTRYGPFSGPARLCEIRSRVIAGRRIGERDPDRERPPGRMLVATVLDGAPPVPVRIDVEAPFGSFIVHLTGVERRKEPWRRLRRRGAVTAPSAARALRGGRRSGRSPDRRPARRWPCGDSRS